MAIIGLLKSSSFMPVARQSALAPAMLRPCVVVCERYLGIGYLLKVMSIDLILLQLVSHALKEFAKNSRIALIVI